MSSWFRSPRRATPPAPGALLSLCELDGRIQPAVVGLSSLLTRHLALGVVAEVSWGATPPGPAAVVSVDPGATAGRSPAGPGLLGGVSGLLGSITAPLVDVTGSAVSAVLQTATALVRPAVDPAEAPAAPPPVGPGDGGPTGGGAVPEAPVAGEATPPPGEPLDRPVMLAGDTEAPAAEVAQGTTGGTAESPPAALPVAPSQPAQTTAGPATVAAPVGADPSPLAAPPGSDPAAALTRTSPAGGSETAVAQLADGAEPRFSGSAPAGNPAPDPQVRTAELSPEPLAAIDAAAAGPVAPLPESPDSPGAAEPAGVPGGADGVSAGTNRTDGGPPDALLAPESQPAAGDAARDDRPAGPNGPVVGGGSLGAAVEGVARALDYVADAAGLPELVFPQDLSSVQAELEAYLDGLEGVVDGIDPGPEGRWVLYAAAGAAGFYLESRRAKRRRAVNGLPASA